MGILCSTWLPNDRVHAIPAENSTTIKTTPVTDNVTDAVVAPIKTIVSVASSFEVRLVLILSFLF